MEEPSTLDDQKSKVNKRRKRKGAGLAAVDRQDFNIERSKERNVDLLKTGINEPSADQKGRSIKCTTRSSRQTPADVTSHYFQETKGQEGKENKPKVDMSDAETQGQELKEKKPKIDPPDAETAAPRNNDHGPSATKKKAKKNEKRESVGEGNHKEGFHLPMIQ